MLLSWAVPEGAEPRSRATSGSRCTSKIIRSSTATSKASSRKGKYGGGTVMLWDRGTWTPSRRSARGLKQGHLKFTLDGEKLHGRLDARAHARPQRRRATTSVAPDQGDATPTRTGRRIDRRRSARQRGDAAATLDEIARRDANACGVPKQVGRGEREERAPSHAASHATASRMPRRRRARRRCPTDLAAARDAGERRLRQATTGSTRSSTTATGCCAASSAARRGCSRATARTGPRRFPTSRRDLARAAGARPRGSTARWSCSTQRAARASRRCRTRSRTRTPRASRSSPSTCCTSTATTCAACRLTERKRVLRELVAEGVRHRPLQRPSVAGDGADFFAQACKLGLEGIVSQARRLDATRPAAHARLAEGQMHAAPGDGDRRLHRSAGLAQGLRRAAARLPRGRQAALRRQGRHGLRRRDAAQAHAGARQARRATSPRSRIRRAAIEAKGAHWVRPDLVAEIAFTEWSHDGALRHPSFQGLRPDKKAAKWCASVPSTTLPRRNR